MIIKDSGTFLFYVSKMIQKSQNWNLAWSMFNVPDTKNHNHILYCPVVWLDKNTRHPSSLYEPMDL